MVQAALILEDFGTLKVEVIRALRTFCTSSISDVTAAVAASSPLFVRPLFSRDHPEFPVQLLSFIDWLETNSLPYRAYQVLDDQHFDADQCDRYYVLTASRLKNIISTRVDSLEQQRKLGRLQEGIEDEMRFETEGKISLWLFRETADEDLDDDILKTQFGIMTYDEDMLEVGGSDEWKMTPLRKVFEPMSYSASWVEDALASAKELGIKNCRRAFFILNFAYDPQKVQNPLPADPVFIGVFDYADDD